MSFRHKKEQGRAGGRGGGWGEHEDAECDQGTENKVRKQKAEALRTTGLTGAGPRPRGSSGSEAVTLQSPGCCHTKGTKSTCQARTSALLSGRAGVQDSAVTWRFT